MKIRRWRLATMMGLVGLIALGIKGTLYFLPKHDIVRDRLAWMGFIGRPLPNSPQIEAELVALLDDPEAHVRWYALYWLDEVGSTEPAMIPKLVERLMAETIEQRHRHRHNPNQIEPARSLIRFQLPASVIAPLLRPAMLTSVDELARSRAIHVLAEAAGRGGKPSDPTLVTLLLGALNDPQPTNRLHAAEGLARLDEGARRRAVAVLGEQVRGPDRPMALVAAANLARFDSEGGAGARALADRLVANGDDPKTRVEDLYLLARIGPPARVAVPAIVRAMTSPDPRQFAAWPIRDLEAPQEVGYNFTNIGVYLSDIRGRPEFAYDFSSGRAGAMGAVALYWIGPEAEREAVALLTGMLEDEAEEKRLAAAAALGDLGPRASSAFEKLVALAERTATRRETPDWSQTSRLVQTLTKVRCGDDPELVATLIRLLASGNGPGRHAAASALAYLKPPALAAIPALVAAARDPGQGTRWSVAIALGRYDPERRDFVAPALLRLLDDPDEFVRLLAAESLGQLKADTTRAVAVALDVLRSGNHNQRWRAVEALGRLGPAARAAVPALIAARSDPDRAIRDNVEEALKRIDPSVVAGDGSARPDSP